MIFRLPPLKIVMYRSIKTIKRIKIKLEKIVMYLIVAEKYVCGCPIDKRSDLLGLFVIVPDFPSELGTEKRSLHEIQRLEGCAGLQEQFPGGQRFPACL